MTDKRFKEIVSTETIVDTVTDKRYIGIVDSSFIELINEISKENEELKKRTMIFQDKIRGLMK